MSDCKFWHKSTDRDGYGQVVVDGKRLLAHRLAYCEFNNLNYSDIKGKVVRHKCDNPTCVNPLHLELGSHADNMADRAVRNRTAKGEVHGRAKLSEVDIKTIRDRYIRGSKVHGLSAIAKDFGVAFQTVSKIVNHHKWQSIR